MKKTKKRAQSNKTRRRKHDFYPTLPKLAEFIVDKVSSDGLLPCLNNVLEPSFGTGTFIEAIQKYQPKAVCGVDIKIRSPLPVALSAENVVLRKGDFVKVASEWERNVTVKGDPSFGFDVILGNPPFKHAESHTRAALKLLNPGGVLIFLLRLGFCESKARIRFWKQYPARKIYALSERPSFTGGGTDQTAYAVFVWRRPYPNEEPVRTEFEVVSWKGEEA